jgi:hypothetical protein
MGIQPVRGLRERERDMPDKTDGQADDDFVAFITSGSRATGQHRCAECGYGITVRGKLPDCPMCGGNAWEKTAWSPISNATAFESPTTSL